MLTLVLRQVRGTGMERAVVLKNPAIPVIAGDDCVFLNFGFPELSWSFWTSA